jgi:hypothetical protein
MQLPLSLCQLKHISAEFKIHIDVVVAGMFRHCLESCSLPCP